MSKNAASESKLGELHMAVADALIAGLDGVPVIKDGEPVLDEDGDPVTVVDPRIISSAITFLNNNKVTMNPFLEDKASEIQKRLRARSTKFKAIAGGAASRAAENV